MDWLGGYPTVCHGAVFAAANSVNLSLLSTGACGRSRHAIAVWGFSQLGLPAPFVFQRSGGAGAMKLVDRRAECGMLDRLVEAVVGESRALVLCGESSVGKTALLQHLIATAVFKITVHARSGSC
jgi:hypothetical protein